MKWSWYISLIPRSVFISFDRVFFPMVFALVKTDFRSSSVRVRVRGSPIYETCDSKASAMGADERTRRKLRTRSIISPAVSFLVFLLRFPVLPSVSLPLIPLCESLPESHPCCLSECSSPPSLLSFPLTKQQRQNSFPFSPI
jgi:hypothetical protein